MSDRILAVGEGYWHGHYKKFKKHPQLQVRPAPDQGWANQHLCDNITGKTCRASALLLAVLQFWRRCERNNHADTKVSEGEADAHWSSHFTLVHGGTAAWAPSAVRDQHWSRILSAVHGGPHTGTCFQRKPRLQRADQAGVVCHWEDSILRKRSTLMGKVCWWHCSKGRPWVVFP